MLIVACIVVRARDVSELEDLRYRSARSRSASKTASGTRVRPRARDNPCRPAPHAPRASSSPPPTRRGSFSIFSSLSPTSRGGFAVLGEDELAAALRSRRAAGRARAAAPRARAWGFGRRRSPPSCDRRRRARRRRRSTSCPVCRSHVPGSATGIALAEEHVVERDRHRMGVLAGHLAQSGHVQGSSSPVARRAPPVYSRKTGTRYALGASAGGPAWHCNGSGDTDCAAWRVS